MGKFAVMSGSFGALLPITVKLLENGVFVFCLDLDDDVGVEMEKRYKNCKFIRADVSLRKDLELARDEVLKKTDKIDYLVNGVCKNPFKAFSELSFEEIEDSFNKTLMSYLLSIKFFWDMFRDGGSIVNISSVNSIRTKKNFSIYSIGKAGVNALTRSTSLELRDRGVRVNSVVAGGFADELYKKMNSDWEDKLAKGQVSRPEDIAEVVFFLLGSNSKAINGESVVCDCGLGALSARSSDL